VRDEPPGAHERLTVEGLQAGYGSSFVLRGVTFDLEPGSVLGLLGPNGSGKSTLLKALAGVLPARVGTVTYGQRPLCDFAARIAFVPQREDVNWDFPITARDVVLMGRYRRAGWLRRPGRHDRAVADEALDRMGLAGMEGRHISQFSGGQQQRIFLARALAQEPVVVLLDEPFTGVDVENRAVFRATIAAFARRGVTVIMSTHDFEAVTEVCSHVALLNGRLLAFGPKETTYTADNLRAAFGGQVAILSLPGAGS